MAHFAATTALQEGGARIESIPDEEFNKVVPQGVVAAYDSQEDRIVIPASAMQGDQTELLRLLAHEGLHWMQDKAGRSGNVPATYGGRLAEVMTQGNAARASNGIDEQRWNDEAQAYYMGAIMAQELGIQDTGSPATNPQTGQVAPYDEIYQRIANTAAYNGHKEPVAA